MVEASDDLYESLSTSDLARIDRVCERFEVAFGAGEQPRIADFLGDIPEEQRGALERELRVIEAQLSRREGEAANAVPEPPGEVAAARADLDETQPPDGFLVERPRAIGRYRISQVLGEGGYGTVYLAEDEELKRRVAVKVPHRHQVRGREDIELYLEEARAVARLDHPAIVPVYDAGQTEDGLCYVVSKFIEGTDLAKRTAQARLSHAESAELVATIAEGLHHAHLHGLVHRDVKPGNILLELSGRPYLADFGLALKEEDFGKRATTGGTALYMSPEQARGEGHRVDGRADIFSLGIVFYELLTGRRPFRGENLPQLFEQITTMEPRPPRQVDDRIPRELERICLKALSKRVSDRYTTARDLADDLRHFLERARPLGRPSGAVAEAASGPAISALAAAPTAAFLESDRLLKIVPKGLRSFDARDADFFLELLPGPRDRDGLPESIRFWKSRIEETDPDKTFAVGLIYGPSGCGKTSLVQAGLLPRLAGSVIPVYVEATAGETENRLLRGLRKHWPELPPQYGPKASLAALRRGEVAVAGRKVLIVLDQFEQWLHASREAASAELAEALRQCDGERVQCVVMVRDDFWMAVSRFMQELETQLVEGRNVAAVDVFDLRHARKVLGAFGRAFGALPASAAEPAKDREDFLEQAVAGLAQEGKVVCIRLALFAEMMKGKPWTRTTLKAVGGAEGIGVAFLEETFGARGAHPRYRFHENAARLVLRKLLPEHGTDIKGHMRSYQELADASGYAPRPKDFEELVRILDGELRLVTPTDPEGPAAQDKPGVALERKYYQLTHDYLVPSLRAWLTRKQKETRCGRAELRLAERAALWTAKPENRHLPSLWESLGIRLLTKKRDWTEPQQRMMRAEGRYHLVRGFLIAVLLALVGWRGYEWHGGFKAKSLVEQLMSADIAKVSEIVQQSPRYRRWAVPLLWDERDSAEENSEDKLKATLALMGLTASDEAKQDLIQYLKDQLLRCDAHELRTIRDALLPTMDELLRDALWSEVQSAKDLKSGAPQGPKDRGFRAACALAKHDFPEGAAGAAEWDMEVSRFVAGELVSEIARDPNHYAPLVDALRPASEQLLEELSRTCRDGRSQAERLLAASILAEYAADRPDKLVRVLRDADQKQFEVLFGRLAEYGKKYPKDVINCLEKELLAIEQELLAKSPENAADEEKAADEKKKEELASQCANLAVALLRMDQPGSVWPLLRHSPDPSVRSYIIHRAPAMGVRADVVIQRLKEPERKEREETKDVEVRRALILMLGEYGESELPWPERSGLVPRLLEIYESDPDPGLHAAAEWLLLQWADQAKRDQAKPDQSKGEFDKTKSQLNDPQGESDKIRRQIDQINRKLATRKPEQGWKWYLTKQGHTMVLIPPPKGEFQMGSPKEQPDRAADEHRRPGRIDRPFYVSSKEVTRRQFEAFLADLRKSSPNVQLTPEQQARSPDLDCPIMRLPWDLAARYCNWLSEKEGLPKCYVENKQGHMEEAKDCLTLTGYRLPTEAEWEWSSLAGAETGRYYGRASELLDKYAWHHDNAGNRSHPVARKKPNDFGLFDVYGNAWEWCHDVYRRYLPDGKPGEEYPDQRVCRGGSNYGSPPWYLRSPFRYWFERSQQDYDIGFRVARTCP